MKKNMFATVLVIFPLILTNAQPLSGPFPVPPGTNTSVGFASIATNVANPVVNISYPGNNTVGATETITPTNIYVDSTHHISYTNTASRTNWVSNDGAFAGFKPLDQFSISNSQFEVFNVVNSNLVVAYQINGGGYTPSVNGFSWTNYTGFTVYPAPFRWTDINGVQYGGGIDANGSVGKEGLNDQGWDLYYASQSGNAGLFSAGIIGEANVGLSGGGVLYAISSGFGTGGASGNAVFFIDSRASYESFGIGPDSTVYIGSGNAGATNIMNRHGTDETFGNNVRLSNGKTFIGDGSSITNMTISYRTNVINGITNVNTSQRVESWKIPAFATEPAATLGNAEIDAQVQRADGVWMTLSKVDIAGGATSILQTNRENLTFDVYTGESWRLTNSTSGTGYTAGLDATSTNSVTRY